MKRDGNRYGWAVTGVVWMVAVAVYGVMPDRMATHWNATGMANGYSGKFWGLFLIPIIMVVIQGLFMVLPKMDPLQKNDRTYKEQFGTMSFIFALFMAYLFGVVAIWNMGIGFDMNRVLAPAFAGLFYSLGMLMKKVKRNWFIGIRTPWTLSSDQVWDRTHALGGELFKLSGLIALLGLVTPRYLIGVMLVPVIASAVVSVVYSYLLFRKQK